MADWPHRCDVCDLPCRSARGVAIHKSRAHKNRIGEIYEDDDLSLGLLSVDGQEFKDTLADRKVREDKWEAQQKQRPTVLCNSTPLENVYKFKYLGSLFIADAQERFYIDARIAMATKRCAQLKHIFDSPNIGPRLKIRLYAVAVCSLLTYGCESWTLTDRVKRRINGANSQMLARITGHSVCEEARPATTSFDVVRHIRVMRLQWLATLLRDDNLHTRYIYSALALHTHPGDLLLSDAPPHTNL